MTVEEYYSWGDFSLTALRKLSLQNLQILAEFSDFTRLDSGRARQAFDSNRMKVLEELRIRQQEEGRKSSSSPEVELRNLRAKVQKETEELASLRLKRKKINQIELDLERKIQRQQERIDYLESL